MKTVNHKNVKVNVPAQTVVMADGRPLESVVSILETAVNTIHRRQIADSRALENVEELLARTQVDARAAAESRLVGADKVVMKDGVTLAGAVETFQKQISVLTAQAEGVEVELHRFACSRREEEALGRGTDRQSHESVQRLMKEVHGLLEEQSRRIAHLENLNDIVFNQEMERRVKRSTAGPRYDGEVGYSPTVGFRD